MRETENESERGCGIEKCDFMCVRERKREFMRREREREMGKEIQLPNT